MYVCIKILTTYSIGAPLSESDLKPCQELGDRARKWILDKSSGRAVSEQESVPLISKEDAAAAFTSSMRGAGSGYSASTMVVSPERMSAAAAATSSSSPAGPSGSGPWGGNGTSPSTLQAKKSSNEDDLYDF